MDWYAEGLKSVIRSLGSSWKSGLGEAEVQKRFVKFGENVLREYRRKSRLGAFLDSE